MSFLFSLSFFLKFWIAYAITPHSSLLGRSDLINWIPLKNRSWILSWRKSEGVGTAKTISCWPGRSKLSFGEDHMTVNSRRPTGSKVLSPVITDWILPIPRNLRKRPWASDTQPEPIPWVHEERTLLSHAQTADTQTGWNNFICIVYAVLVVIVMQQQKTNTIIN